MLPPHPIPHDASQLHRILFEEHSDAGGTHMDWRVVSQRERVLNNAATAYPLETFSSSAKRLNSKRLDNISLSSLTSQVWRKRGSIEPRHATRVGQFSHNPMKKKRCSRQNTAPRDKTVKSKTSNAEIERICPALHAYTFLPEASCYICIENAGQS